MVEGQRNSSSSSHVTTYNNHLSLEDPQADRPDSSGSQHQYRQPERPRSAIFFSPIYNPKGADDNSGYSKPIKHHRKILLGAEEGQRTQTQASDVHGRSKRSPIRMCIVTREQHATKYLINLRPTYFPSSSSPPTTAAQGTSANQALASNGASEAVRSPIARPAALYLLPDRVVSPARLRSGKGCWVQCDREIIDRLCGGKGPHIGMLRSIDGLQVPPNLALIIHLQLLQRVKYEIDLLAKRLATHPLPSPSPLPSALSPSTITEGRRRPGSIPSASGAIEPEKKNKSELKSVDGAGISEAEGPNMTEVVMRQLDKEEAPAVRAGSLNLDADKGGERIIALIDSSNMETDVTPPNHEAVSKPRSGPDLEVSAESVDNEYATGTLPSGEQRVGDLSFEDALPLSEGIDYIPLSSSSGPEASPQSAEPNFETVSLSSSLTSSSSLSSLSSMLPSAQNSISSHIPLYTLSSLFPKNEHPALLRSIQHILRAERRYQRKLSNRSGKAEDPSRNQKKTLSSILALYSNTPSPTTFLPSVPLEHHGNGINSEYSNEEREEEIKVVQSQPAGGPGPKSRAEDPALVPTEMPERTKVRRTRDTLGDDLAISLWRLALFRGHPEAKGKK